MAGSTEAEVHKHVPCVPDHTEETHSLVGKESVRILQVFCFIRAGILNILFSEQGKHAKEKFLKNKSQSFTHAPI